MSSTIQHGHYDRDADIAWITFEGWDRDSVIARETPFGLQELDAEGRTVGLEYWSASEWLPPELLAALPAPAAAR